MTGLTFVMLDGRKERNKTNKQRNKIQQDIIFQKKPDASPDQYLMF